MPQQLVDKNGVVHTVPDDKVQAALDTGQFSFGAGQKIPVKYNGKVGYVSPQDYRAYADRGATIPTSQEIHDHELQKKYGDTTHALEAAGIAALDSATLGASNAAIGFLGGEDTRKKLREIQEANPTATKIGHVAGVAAPLAVDIATGGEATPALAPELGEVASGAKALLSGGDAARAAETAETGGSLLRKGSNLLSSPQRAVTKVGDIVDHGVQSLIGSDAESLIGRLAQKGISSAARGAAEGALYGGADYIGEQSLEDHPDLSGEKLAAAMGHGAILGGALSGSLGLSGQVGKEILGKLAPRLGDKADNLVISAIDKSEKFRKEVEELPGGASAFRARMVNDGAVSMADDAQSIAPKIQVGLANAEDALSQTYKDLEARGHVDTAIPLKDIHRAIDSLESHTLNTRLEEASGLGGGKKIRDAVREIVDNTPPPGVSPEDWAKYKTKIAEAPLVKGERRTGKEIAEYLRAHPEIKIGPKGELPDQAVYKTTVRTEEHEPEMTLSQVVDLQKNIREIASQATGRAKESLLHIHNAIGDLIENHVAQADKYEGHLEELSRAEEQNPSIKGVVPPRPDNDAAKFADWFDESSKIRTSRGSSAHARMEDLGQKLQAVKQYRLAQEYVSRAADGELSHEFHRSHGLLGGRHTALGGAALGFMHGGIHGAVTGGLLGTAAQIGKKLVKERGKSTAGVILDKLSAIRTVQNAQRRIDVKIAKGVAKIVKTVYKDETRRITAESEGSYEDHIKTLRAAAKDPDLHAEMIRQISHPISSSMPKVSNAFQQTAIRSTLYLISKIPPNPAPKDSLFPQDKKEYSPSTIQKSKFDRIYDVVMDPTVVLDRVASGSITKDEIEAVTNTHPELYKQMVDALRTELSQSKTPPTFAVQTAARMFIGMTPIPQETYSAIMGVGQTSSPSDQEQGKGKKKEKTPKISRPLGGSIGKMTSLSHTLSEVK